MCRSIGTALGDECSGFDYTHNNNGTSQCYLTRAVDGWCDVMAEQKKDGPQPPVGWSKQHGSHAGHGYFRWCLECFAYTVVATVLGGVPGVLGGVSGTLG